MRIAYITAGAAGMYCGSCLHDNTLAKALIARGHEVALTPLYTPIRTDETDVSGDRIFYGAVNVYLEQKSTIFRAMPRFVGRWLANRKLLNWASSRGSSSVSGHDLAGLLLSTLQGEEGRQKKDLEELVDWLRDEFRPDIVHLSNSLMIGLARRIRAETKAPVLVSLQGEDLFLDEMEPHHLEQAKKLIVERSADIDGFVATSSYYAEYMQQYLGLKDSPVHTVNLGIDTDDLCPAEPEEGRPFTIGYLARIAPEKGTHVLLEAFRRLCEAGGPPCRLEIAGYQGEKDRAYLHSLRADVAAWGLESQVRFHGEIDRSQKIGFLHSLDVLSVPTVYHEPKGLFVLEALSCGIPVVQPNHGAFPEMIEATGGGLLVPSEDAQALAETLAKLAAEPETAREMGRRGREGVLRHYSATIMAARTEELYERYAGPVLSAN